MKKIIAEYKRTASKAGWEITRTKNGHLRWQSPRGPFVFTPSTPSDHRSILNIRADLRRAGLAI